MSVLGAGVRRLGDLLRLTADRIDPGGQTCPSGLSFTFEDGRGYVLHGEPGVHRVGANAMPGCPLMYDPRQYARAHDEAGTNR